VGADGHWLVIRREEFQAAFPDVKPEDIGIYPVTVLGVEALAGYHDTNGIDFADHANLGLVNRALRSRDRIDIVRREGMNGAYERAAQSFPSFAARIVEADEVADLARIEAEPDYPAQLRKYEALRWFQKNAEDHCVWT
jgi:hypothetical protein